MQTNPTEAMLFLSAGYNSAALNRNKREARAEITALMIAAIRGGMAFEPTDAAPLQELAARGAIRGFDPFDKRFYREACLAGSPYCGVWRHEQARREATRPGTSV